MNIYKFLSIFRNKKNKVDTKEATNQDYMDFVKNIPKPTPQETESFIKMVISQHSWHKRVSWEEPLPFMFFLDPNINNNETGHWNYLGPGPLFKVNPKAEWFIHYNDKKVMISSEISEKCSVGLTGCLHPGMASDSKLKPDDEFTLKEKHLKDVDKLRTHLYNLLDFFYD